MAKEPAPGRVKTRLCPPLTPNEAAAVAEAALADTLDAVAASGADRRVLALDGRPGPWLPEGFEVIPQSGSGFAARLAAAWEHAGGAGVQIGMDTPQVTAGVLDAAMADVDAAAGGPGIGRGPARSADAEAAGRPKALLGPALDGGWWAIGLPHPVPGAFAGVPMSTPRTGWLQARRLEALGWEVATLGALRDIDTAEDLVAVAADLPGSRLASVVAGLSADGALLSAAGASGR
ncbi:DUF2064 domain-containing protein [Acidiferrimicrobium sp. IK]|uniref:TIGR04282 family arsenosugar biosynthesis glycosyltransferase n=1 Tax=Acidiferrimicrobium sp. IK TaxID=2871700 RepID=UPI0021CB3769|nr:DUF2064 domain-containing protein [Acidiferrimicrobium sp. IK]MCU4184865.1 DUF2064 domain-containing protein [Acidiferrimicrobium sp. IK]